MRSPLKFVKGEFRESDYESDYDGRIQPIWRPYDSESEEPVYKPVRPGFKTVKQVDRYQAPRVIAPSQPRQLVGPPAFDLKPGSPPEIGYAPSPDVHRSVSFVESELGENATLRTTHFLSSNGAGAVVDDHAASYGTLERKAEAKRLQRVDEMRKRFEQKSLVPTESDPVSVQTYTQGIQGTYRSVRRMFLFFLILTLQHNCFVLKQTKSPPASHKIMNTVHYYCYYFCHLSMFYYGK